MRLTLLALAFSTLLQVATSSPRELVRLQRPLTGAEIDTVVRGIRQALAGKTLRLIDRLAGEPEILMRRDGMTAGLRLASRGREMLQWHGLSRCSKPQRR